MMLPTVCVTVKVVVIMVSNGGRDDEGGDSDGE